MAVDWLDCARFADTNGYQVDRDREMSAWRDWVIDAFNSNQPFDQFTVDQLAGDLLPDATLKQKIATGFHRNHMFNEEGGAIPEEFLAEYCADRVDTTATVWLGLTLNCCRCHDHKFDPFTQRDYYSLFAFFHNVPEVGLGNAGLGIGRTAPPSSNCRLRTGRHSSTSPRAGGSRQQFAAARNVKAPPIADWRTVSKRSGGRSPRRTSKFPPRW